MNSRLFKIKDELKRQKVDAALVSSIPNITYLTGFSGFSKEEREALLFITPDKQYILTDKRYRDEISNIIYSSSDPAPPESREVYKKNRSRQARAINIFQLEVVSSSIPFKMALEKLIKKHKIKKLGIEDNDLKVSEYITLKKIFKTKSALISFKISENRSIKEQSEIDAIEKACELTDKTFEYILTKIKSGITEKELAFEIEFFIKKNGGDLAFSPIVAFGKNSAIPHHKTANAVLCPERAKRVEGQIILFDFGAKIDNYCSDMTRVVFLGKATDEQKKVYQIVLDAQKRAIEIFNDRSYILNHQLKSAEVDKVAHDYIRSKGYGDNIFHSLGHGVGLEIHESPHLSSKSKEILKPGMVFTIEPGVYLPEKFGVRIEDTVVLGNNGLRILTKSKKQLMEL